MKKYILIALVALAVIHPTYSEAGILDFLFKKEEKQAPKENPNFPRSEEAFTQNSGVYHDIPYNNPKYDFELRIPKSWKATPVITNRSLPNKFAQSITKEVPYDIVTFKSTQLKTYSVDMKVQGISLEHEISGEDWLKRYVTINSYAPLENVKRIAENRNRAEVEFTQTIGGDAVYTQIVAEKNQDIILILRFDMPLQVQEYTKPTRQHIIKSFKMLLPTDKGVEEQKTKIFGGNDLRIPYPTSWEEYTSNTKNMNKMHIQLHNYSGLHVKKYSRQELGVNGMIKVIAIKRREETNLENEIETLKEDLFKDLNITVQELLFSKEAKAYDRFLLKRYEAYTTVMNADNGKQDQDLHLAILGDRQWYVFIYLYTPKAENDFYNWARNTETFRRIVKEIR